MSTSEERVDKSDSDESMVEMPRSTIWPVVLALGVAMLVVGLVTNIAFSVIGLALALLAVGGWINEMRPEHGEEYFRVKQPAPIGPSSTPVDRLEGRRGIRLRLPTEIHPISSGVRGGIVGGICMPVPAAIWGILSGHGIWYPMNLLVGTVLPGMADASVNDLEAFHPLYLVIGIIIHAAMSVVLGLVYGVILPTLPRGVVPAILAGGIVMPLLWTGVCHGLMGLINPLLAGRVDWLWFVVSQVVFGLAASIVIAFSEMVPVPPAGPGE